jgi:hypothetical protein
VAGRGETQHARHYPGGLRQIGGQIFYLFDVLRDKQDAETSYPDCRAASMSFAT